MVSGVLEKYPPRDYKESNPYSLNSQLSPHFVLRVVADLSGHNLNVSDIAACDHSKFKTSALAPAVHLVEYDLVRV